MNNFVRRSTQVKLYFSVILFVAILTFCAPQIVSSLEWTDPTLTPDNPIRAVHFTELRSQVNNQRFQCGLGAYSFTDTIVSKTTPIRRTHLMEIKEAIEQISTNGSVPRSAPAMPNIVTINAGSTAISLNHVTDLRDSLENSTCCGDGVCQSSDETSVNCPGDCLCTYTPSSGTTCGEMGCPTGSVLITQTAAEGVALCPNKYSCENKPSLCCSYYLSAVGCGDGIHCGETQSMTEKVGQGCVIPEFERYLCGADESCCTYTTTDLGCGPLVDTVQYPYYTRVYQSTDAAHPQCLDKIETVDNVADCCDYTNAVGCGTNLVDADSNIYNTCDSVTYDEGTYVDCTWSDTFPVECSPTITSEENSSNCCTYAESSICIDKVDLIGPTTYVGVTKQTTSEDVSNPDCDPVVTLEDFHDDCCGYNSPPRDECENSTDWVQYLDPDNADCPAKSSTQNTSTDDTSNICCNYGPTVDPCGGQCNGRGDVYPQGTRVVCTPAGNSTCEDIVATFPNDPACCGFIEESACGGKFNLSEPACGGDGTYSMSDYITCNISATKRGAGCDDVLISQDVNSDLCCQYSTGGLGCGATCNGTTSPADTNVTACEISSTGYCPNEFTTEENHNDCCNFVTDTDWQCGGTCAGVNFDPDEAYRCTRPTTNIGLCTDGETVIIADEATSIAECCNYALTNGCGIDCDGTTYTDIEYVTCQTSAVPGCDTIETATTTMACCDYSNVQNCNIECNDVNYGENTWVSCNEVPDAMKPFGCTDQLVGAPVVNSNTCCNYGTDTDWGFNIGCDGVNYPNYYQVTCQTSAVADCDDILVAATDQTDTYCNYNLVSGYNQECDGTTYGVGEYTECLKKQAGAPGFSDPYCDDVLVSGPTLDGDGTYCQYTQAAPTYAGCGVDCDGVNYPTSDYVVCRTSLTGNAGCDAPTVLQQIVDDSRCCAAAEYTTESDCGRDCGNVTTYDSTDMISCTYIPAKPSCPVSTSIDPGHPTCCPDYTITEDCGITCNGTDYDDNKYVTCYESATAGCDKSPVIAPNSDDLCCEYAAVPTCGPIDCDSTSYDDTTLVTCKTSSVAGCTPSTLLAANPFDASCCNWSDWQPYGGGAGCGLSLTPADIARLASGPTSCNPIQSLQVRMPTNPNCPIATRCVDDCGDCIYNAASNPYQSCDLGPSCLGQGTQFCKENNEWDTCTYTTCSPLSTISCSYLTYEVSDPYRQLDYKICDPCGFEWGDCSCGHHPMSSANDQVSCNDAFAPCPSDFDTNYYSCVDGKLKRNTDTDPIDNCPGIRSCVSNEWSSTCEWKETFGNPLSFKGQCEITAPDGLKYIGAYKINECGTDYLRDNGDPICFCQGDVAGKCKPFSECNKEDGVYKCQPDGSLTACETLTEGTYRRWMYDIPRGPFGDSGTCPAFWKPNPQTYDRCGKMSDCQ